jgi:hypothetical protein
MSNCNGDCRSRRESAQFTDESRSANRETVIVTAGRGLTRVVKIDAWSILLFEFKGKNGCSFPWNKDIAMERGRNEGDRVGKRVCHQRSKDKDSLTFVRAAFSGLESIWG